MFVFYKFCTLLSFSSGISWSDICLFTRLRQSDSDEFCWGTLTWTLTLKLIFFVLLWQMSFVLLWQMSFCAVRCVARLLILMFVMAEWHEIGKAFKNIWEAYGCFTVERVKSKQNKKQLNQNKTKNSKQNPQKHGVSGRRPTLTVPHASYTPYAVMPLLQEVSAWISSFNHAAIPCACHHLEPIVTHH